jgi:hypothetical protein
MQIKRGREIRTSAETMSDSQQLVKLEVDDECSTKW